MAWICSITSASTLGGWPPAHSSASTSEVNSWPMGMAAKRMPMSAPARVIWKEGRRASWPSKRAVILAGAMAAISSSSRISAEAGRSSRLAISSMGWVMRSR
jgi:hypothetical protein